MEQSVRDAISRIVRGIVKDAYGELTCAGTVKVLAEVLKKGWGIQLSPHVVSLRIVPPRVLAIMEKVDLTSEQKLELIQQLPGGEKPKAIESGKYDTKFHMVGLSGSGSSCVLWDPSIDQVNRNFDSCKLEPVSLQMSDSRTDDDENIVFSVQGCQLIYREQKDLEETVFASEAWLTDYSNLYAKALEEVQKVVEVEMGASHVG
jgi:hypothetical protein